MKKQLLMGTLAVAVMAGATAPVFAEDAGAGFDVSANVGLVSDYVWRGVSQSNNQAAIQGGIDVKHSSGAYLGTWMSSLSGWYSSPTTGYAATEQDVYVGYGMSVTEAIAVDLRYTEFLYGNASSANFSEYHVALSGFGATVGADYSEHVPTLGTSIHYYGSYGYTLPMDIGLAATVGEYDLKDDYRGNNNSYAYWTIGASKKVAGVTLGLSYNNSDLTGVECASFAGGITNTTNDSHSACGEQFVFSATKAL